MTSRRRLLSLLAAGAASLSGCSFSLGDGDSNDVPGPNTGTTRRATPTTETPTPNTETSTPTDRVLDIRDFGAAVDGETDDTDAVLDAIATATAHDTVFFPPGETVLSGVDRKQDAAILLNGDSTPEGLTLAGAGRDSVLRMADNQPRYHETIYLDVQSGFEDLTIRDLRLDGNKKGQSFKPGSGGHGIKSDNADSANVPVDVLIQNVWAENYNMTGITVRHGGIVIDWVTARGNVKHGIAVDTSSDVGKHDPPIMIRNTLCIQNGHEGAPVTYGIDCSGGKAIVEDTVLDSNAQGTKTTAEGIETVYRRVRISNSAVFGYIRPGNSGEQRATVTFEDVVSEGSGQAGFRLSTDTDYIVPTEIVATGNRKSNLYITSNARLDAERVWANRSRTGFGIFCDSSAGGSVASYHPYKNQRGASALEGNLELKEQTIGDKTDIEGVPTAAEVGAGTLGVRIPFE